jgi:hypothetical protein
MPDNEHPFDSFEYVVETDDGEKTEVEVTKESPDANSPVRGLLKRIEEASKESVGLHANHTITFAGMICPIICETDDKIQIQHGHTKLWLPRDQASKALSARKKEPKEKWMSIFVSPSSQEEKK